MTTPHNGMVGTKTYLNVATLPELSEDMAALRYAGIRGIETIRHAFALRLGSGRCSCVAKSEQYRRFAQECLLLARAAEDQRARASLLHMAHVWFRLAEEHENEAEEKQSAES